MNKRIINFDFILLDKFEREKKKLRVNSGSLSYSSLSGIKRTASLTVADDKEIDYSNDRVKIISEIDGERKDFATLLMSSGRKIHGQNLREVECYDKVLILDESGIKERLVIKAGSNVIGEIVKQLGSEPHRLEPQSYQTQVDVDFEIGTSRLEVINYLLGIINYESIQVDNEGFFTSRKYRPPDEREIEIEYSDKKDSGLKIVLPNPQEELDFFKIPNVFIRATNNSQIAPLRAVYVNNNPNSKVSTVNRGREIIDFKTVDDVLDYQTLYDVAKRDALSATNLYQHLTLKTGINIDHGYLNCIGLDIEAYGIKEAMIETSWKIDELKAGGQMTHSLRKMVSI